MRNQKTLLLTEIAIFTSFAMILETFAKIALPLKFWPQGGTISIAMVPVFMIAYRWGTKAGCVTGALFGALQLASGEPAYSLLQALLDYIVAFSVLGIAGVFAGRIKALMLEDNQKWVWVTILSIVAASGLRLGSHILSGFLFFSEFVPEGMPVWQYMALYNIGYIGPSVVLCSIAMVILMKTLPKKYLFVK